MSKVDVSISIVSYNTSEDLKQCLNSIYTFTKGITFEVFVVDNGSIDNTYEMVKKEFPQVIIHKNKNNQYFTKPNNANFKISKGKYFLLLNADTYFTNNSIKKMVDYFQNNQEVGVVEGLEIYEDGRLVPNGSLFSTPVLDFYELSIIGKKIRNKKSLRKYRLFSKKRDTVFEIDVGCDAFLMVRSDLFKKIKGYDERFLLYYTENDICLRIKRLGYKIIHLGNASVVHKVSVSANKLKWKKLDLYYSDLKTYYAKHGFILSGTILFYLLTIEKYLLKVFRPNMFEK